MSITLCIVLAICLQFFLYLYLAKSNASIVHTQLKNRLKLQRSTRKHLTPIWIAFLWFTCHCDAPDNTNALYADFSFLRGICPCHHKTRCNQTPLFHRPGNPKRFICAMYRCTSLHRVMMSSISDQVSRARLWFIESHKNPSDGAPDWWIERIFQWFAKSNPSKPAAQPRHCPHVLQQSNIYFIQIAQCDSPERNWIRLFYISSPCNSTQRRTCGFAYTYIPHKGL